MTEKSPNPDHKPAEKVEINRPGAQADTVSPVSRSTSQSGRAAETSNALFEVVIAGVPLRLKSSHDEGTVGELVALVDQKVKEALPLTKTGSIQNAAILAALHLAEEYFMLKRKAQVELDRLEAKTLKVISEMETSRSGFMNGTRTHKSGEETQIQNSTAENSAAENFLADNLSAEHLPIETDAPGLS